MPKLLIMTDSNFSGAEFAELAESKGYIVKSTSSIKKGLTCLNSEIIDAVLAPITVDSITQQALSGALWENSPNAPYMAFAANETGLNYISTAKIYGAEILFGDLSLAKFNTLIESAAEAKTISPMSVLVVDDLDSTRDIICMYVEGLGNYNTTGQSSAKEAMRELSLNPQKFSCILTDIQMPEVSGKEFISFIRKEPALEHLPIIVLTAYGTMETLIDCLKLGATGFLAKPPKKTDLLRELARANRVIKGLASPRLATLEEAESLESVLIDGWFYE